MPLNGMLVIDAVAHAFDNRPANCRVRYAELQNEGNFRAQEAWLPGEYRTSREEYFRAFDAETMISMFFAESQTDIVCYHTIPAWGVWHDNSPAAIGLEMRQRCPGRVFCYAAVSPGDGTKAIEDLERQAAEWGPIDGVKLYPADFINGEWQEFSMGDEKLVYPIFEKCISLGIGTIAIHKAIPLAASPMDAYRPGDVDFAARDFPGLKFEVVHGGFAFLEETALQVARFENVYINLEGTSALIIRAPRAFAKIIGEVMFWGGPDKVIWATGAMAFHPQPLLKAFERLEMPQDFVKDYGYPELTSEVKAKILGQNWARMHGLDPSKLATAISSDSYARQREAPVAKPWAVLREGAVR